MGDPINVYGTGSAVNFYSNAGGIVNDTDTKLLLTFLGADGSQVFDDLSDSNHTINAWNEAQIATDQSVFGSSALFLSGADFYEVGGTDDALWIPNSADFQFAGNDFSVGMAVRFAGLPENAQAESPCYLLSPQNLNVPNNGVLFDKSALRRYALQLNEAFSEAFSEERNNRVRDKEYRVGAQAVP